MTQETGPILVTRVLDNERLNTNKKLLPALPALGKTKRKKEWQSQSVLVYTQTQ